MWHEARGSLFWLDILSSKLYEKSFTSDRVDFDRCWQLDNIPSLIIENRKSVTSLFILTNKGLMELDLETDKNEIVYPLAIPDNFRTNDGVVCQDGKLMFGVMEKSPTGVNGNLYLLTPEGNYFDLEYPIGIPNTFAQKTNSKVVISDSFERKMHLFDYGGSRTLNVDRELCDFSSLSNESTPDGGTYDSRGRLWVAVWGGDYVSVFEDGVKVASIEDIGVGQPSSCCFGGDDMNYLFITSALEGMSEKKQRKYTKSGMLMVVELEGVKGLKKNSFLRSDD